jgi:hypothetical protein
MFMIISDISKREPLSFTYLRLFIFIMTGAGCLQSTCYGNLLQELVFFHLSASQGKAYYQSGR